MDCLNFLLAFLTHITAEVQVLTNHFCFIDHLPLLLL